MTTISRTTSRTTIVTGSARGTGANPAERLALNVAPRLAADGFTAAAVGLDVTRRETDTAPDSAPHTAPDTAPHTVPTPCSSTCHGASSRRSE
ncbi:hypothetical protein FCH28_12685 [Streptomyces piniterrae]|uniref:Uncharacterized protein n=1 Tax=Streptomyces piniterrae TaxID=2571125 RepID=A0A4U0NJ20_9ACTN|nr:hypothetical protein [Streptomyces piniterrae]TJZ54063.1 hypothetical protein FCH28_12685 [Streptomyces piniterrae]